MTSKKKPVDWDHVKQRLAAAQEAMASGYAPSAPQRQEILRQRARLLAVNPLEAASPGEQIDVLEFVLARERYAIETAWVHEVHPLKALTPLPCTPPFVAGITNLHGRILTVIDLKPLFESATGLDDLHKVIVLRHRDIEFGVLVDRVVGAGVLALAEIQPPVPTLTGVRAEYLRGVTAERLAVLDGRRLLTDPKLVVDEEVAQ